LITGGGGQLAREFARRVPESILRSSEELSITDRVQVEAAIESLQPEIVLNCAAYNAVDRAEMETERAMAVNADGPANLARACHRSGARLVHFSTNYVFDGRAPRPYLESDEPRPLGAYARSKRQGELKVLAEDPKALVIRSAGLFGPGGSASKGGNFPERMLARARAGAELAVVGDQSLNPTYTGHLVEATLVALGSGETGILHLVAAGCCSYHEFAVEVLRSAGVDRQVKRITTPESGASAARPANGCLESERAAPLPSWRQGLREYWLARAGAIQR